MPEQSSKRGQAITGAAFTAPFESHLVRRGVGGLNLKDELDAVRPEQSSRLSNVFHESTGGETSRPGQTTFATGGTAHHSVRKLYQPATGATTRVWGVDTDLYLAASGALGAAIDGGYSGDPLALLPHRPPLSGAPWMFVADRNRMRKVRADGLDLPLGLPAPAAAPAAALGTEYRTSIANFDAADGTEAAAWTGVPGHDANGHVSDTPSASDNAASPTGGSVYFVTNDGDIDSVYDSWWGLALARDLSLLTEVGGAATLPATDDDVLHLWLMTSHPQLIQEIRIYLVVSAVFDPTVLPGTDDTANTDAYVKGFRQNDFVQFIQAQQSQIDAAETARVYALRDKDLDDRATAIAEVEPRTSWADARAVTDPQRAKSLQIGAGVHQWFERGSVGLSLRRGDFQRLGSTTGRDWSTVTGVIVYVRTDITTTDRIVAVGVDDLYLTGGFGLDTMEVGAQVYDWRYTHYDPRTGAEGNGSPEMIDANKLDALRRQVTITPAAYGDADVRQRVYRRGGSLIDDWYFEGENASDGGAFTATDTDDALSAAGTLPIDHFEPFPTVDATGATVLAQPVPALWGPLEGMLLACGDPYRPGHLYWTLPDAPDHASASGNKEICPPSEELMNGGLVGNQAFVFSRERLYLLYPSLSGAATIDYAPTRCKRGIKSRWAFCGGPGGIYFCVENEGIFVTNGGDEEWISRDLDPLFQGETRNGYLPINWAAKTALRLTIWENKLYFLYEDTGGGRRVAVYHLLQKYWLHDTFGRPPTMLQGEDESLLLIGSLTLGKTYTHEGFSDDGLAIACVDRTGVFSGERREEKLLGDQILDADRQGVDLTLTNYLDEEATANAATTVTDETGRQRYVLDVFGDTPQHVHSISTEISWSSAAAAPRIYQLGYSLTVQPELTKQRVTNWDDLGASDEVWLSGVTLDVDTNGETRTIVVERDYNSTREVVATLSVIASGRHKLKFSWASVPAHQVRIRPTDDTCRFWLLYRADWIYQAEPPRVSKWDIHFENAWDQYYTGLDLYCDTAGLTKQVEVWVDQVRLTNPATGLTYFPVLANGRRVVHLTLPWGRGHVFRFVAIDAFPGLLYQHRWQLQEEPSEQANWNQNFSLYGSRADKWLKAIIFECDTYNQVKAVTVEVDGVVVETLQIQASGRKVVQTALTVQHLGRVWRMYPTDSFPGRLYSAQPIFDEEPFQLDRWETQETNHGVPGWFTPLYGHLVLKSTYPVTLTTIVQHNQPRAGSAAHHTTTEYVIPATAGVKMSHFQSFQAGKGVLIRYILTSAAPFWLYKSETVVVIRPWGSPAPITVKPFGDDDTDPTRPMVNSTLAAERAGGSA